MGKPYAKVDVALRDHPKAVGAGPAAMGVWLAALLYIRDHLTDGFVPREVVPSFFGGGAQLNASSMRRLVKAGLFEVAPGGFRLCLYAEKNHTRDEVLAAMNATAERVKKHRLKRVSNAVTDPPCNANVPPSPSPSLSDQDLGEVQEGATAAAAAPPLPPTPSNADPPPEWFADAVAGVALATGEELRVPECWIRYAGHRAAKPHLRAGPEDARYWVTTVCVREAREERQRRALAGSRMRPDEPKPAPYHAPAKSALDVPLDGPAVTAEQMAELARGMP